MKNTPFRLAAAKYIRRKRKSFKGKLLRLQICAFCDGWSAFGDAVDKISAKYKS